MAALGAPDALQPLLVQQQDAHGVFGCFKVVEGVVDETLGLLCGGDSVEPSPST